MKAAISALVLSLALFGWVPGAFAAGPTFSAAGASGQVGTVTVPAGTVHHGDLSLSAGEMIVAGTVDGNVSVGMGKLVVSGRVTGSASVGMGQLVLSHGAVVNGHMSVGMGQIQRLSAGQPVPGGAGGASSVVHVGGFMGPFHRTGLSGWPWLWFGSLWASLLWWLTSLAVVLVLSAAYPRGLEVAEGALTSSWRACLGWGLLLMLCVPPASVLLALTIVGVPLALVLWCAVLAAKILGYAAASVVTGRLVMGRFSATGASLGVAAVVGTAIFFLVGRIPVVGFLLDAAVLFVGVGLAATTGFGTGRRFFRRPA